MEQEQADINWRALAEATKGKTKWRFAPAGAQFRNGATERFVTKFKHTLKHRFWDKMLEMQTAMKIVASVVNSRTIYACYGPRGGNDPDYLMAITPAMLMTGRCNQVVPVRDYDYTDKPLMGLSYIQDLIQAWWEQHKVQNFTSLMPTCKCHEEQRNMRVGNIVLIEYETKSKAGTYWLGRIVQAEKDKDGLVRTCWVKYSLLKELPEDQKLEYPGITKKKIRVSVQRLVLKVPVEELDEVLETSNMKTEVPETVHLQETTIGESTYRQEVEVLEVSSVRCEPYRLDRYSCESCGGLRERAKS